MTDTEQTWYEETITTWLPEKGLVHVFRWVPTFAHYGSRRDPNHPTFDEWLEDMKGATVGLIEPSVYIQRYEEYADHVGVSGHRPMTPDEREQYAVTLADEIARKQRDLEAVVSGL